MDFAILSNPYCKMNKLDPTYNDKLKKVLGFHGQFYVTKSLEELNQTCKNLYEKNIQYIGIVGGDGTLSLVLTYLHHHYKFKMPKILLLKAGTINFLAQNLRLTKNPIDILRMFLSWKDKNHPFFSVHISMLDVNQRLGFIFANQSSTRFLEKYYENKTGKRGAFKELTQIALDGMFLGKLNGQFKKLIQKQKTNLKIQPNLLNLPEVLESTFLFASTVPLLPFGIRMFKKLQLGDVNPELVVVQLEGYRLIFEFSKMFLTNQYQPQYLSTLFEKLELNYHEKTTYSLDGDLILSENGKIHIQKGPAVEFLTLNRIFS